MEGKSEFIAISWLGFVAIFACGFMLASAIEGWRHSEPISAEVFMAVMFALIARSDMKTKMNSGTYRRRLLAWRRESQNIE